MCAKSGFWNFASDLSEVYFYPYKIRKILIQVCENSNKFGGDGALTA